MSQPTLFGPEEHHYVMAQCEVGYHGSCAGFRVRSETWKCVCTCDCHDKGDHNH